MLNLIRALLNALIRFAILQAIALAVIRALCVISWWLLRGSKWVAGVCISGGYDCRKFRPLMGDINLAIAVRRTPPGLGYEICRALHVRLRLARLLNPLVRDVWQTIVTRAQWPLVERYGYLFGAEEWRSLGGAVPWKNSAPLNERLMLAAHWNRQHFWTTMAVRKAFEAQRSMQGLGGSLKRARFFATRLRERIAPGSEIPDQYADWAEDWCAVAWSVRDLARSADLLMRELDMKPGLVQSICAEYQRVQPSSLESRALASMAEAVELDELIAIIGTEGCIVLVNDGTWSLLEYARTLKALALVRRETGVLTFIHTESSFALAPLRGRLRVLRSRLPLQASHGPALPLLLREQLLCQSLYMGTDIWMAAGEKDPRAALEPRVLDALETYAFFLTGELHRDERSWREALQLVSSQDADLRRRLYETRELADLISTGIDPNAEQLFELGSIVFERLASTVVTLDFRSNIRELDAGLRPANIRQVAAS
ncbi:MAG: hypothetical protein H7Z74_12470 [Anaerolineae bacterium]|nr:hypothetical protein [Gemmatimonadaceae bacterium]